MVFNLIEFREWLKNNTPLMPGSINLYVRSARAYFLEHEDLTVEAVNEFVSHGFRKNRTYYHKYAFKYMMLYKGMEVDQEGTPILFKQIVKVKTKPRAKLGKFLPEHMLEQLVSNIPNPLHQDWAIFQLATGARAREIITLREEMIDLEFSADAVKIVLESKGGKETVTFLSRQHEPLLRKYLKGQPGYLFLKGSYPDEDVLERTVQTQRTYYYNSVRQTALALGLDTFGTHDFRRNVVEILKKNQVHPRTLQKILNHSSLLTTMKYFDENREDAKDAVLAMQGKDNAKHQ